MSTALANAIAAIDAKFDVANPVNIARALALRAEQRRNRRSFITDWLSYEDGDTMALHWLSKGMGDFQSFEQAEKRIRRELNRMPLFRKAGRAAPFFAADLRYRLVIATFFRRYRRAATIARAA